MANKLKIKVHESEETLLDTFENLATLLNSMSSQFGARDRDFSWWSDILKIQKGGVPTESPEDIKNGIERARNKINNAFDTFFQQLEKYRKG